jgi:hypothetical protein
MKSRKARTRQRGRTSQGDRAAVAERPGHQPVWLGTWIAQSFEFGLDTLLATGELVQILPAEERFPLYSYYPSRHLPLRNSQEKGRPVTGSRNNGHSCRSRSVGRCGRPWRAR